MFGLNSAIRFKLADTRPEIQTADYNRLATLRNWVGPEEWAKVNERLWIQTLERMPMRSCHWKTPALRTGLPTRYATPTRDCGLRSLYNFGIGDLNKDEDMTATLLTLSRLTRAGNLSACPLCCTMRLQARPAPPGPLAMTAHPSGATPRYHSWTRGQLNVAPGSPDSSDTLVLSCGKVSNGKEFAPFAVRLNPETMIYEVAEDFDMEGWKRDVTGKRVKRNVKPETVRELVAENPTRPALVRAIMAETGCGKSAAYEATEKAEQLRVVFYSKATKTYAARR